MTSRHPATRPSREDVLLRAASLRIVTLHALRILPALPHFRSARNLAADQFEAIRAQVAAQHETLREQLEKSGLWPAMTPNEHRFIETLPFDLEPARVRRAVFECEAAVVLLWAIGMRDSLPAYGESSDPSWLEVVALPPQHFELRPDAEIDRAREIAAAWHWRSRTRQLIEMGQQLPPASGHATWDELIRHATNQAVRQGLLEGFVDGDYGVAGQPYRAVSKQAWQSLAHVTDARHRALSWLSGLAPDNNWDEAPTPT